MQELIMLKILSGTLLFGFFCGIFKGIQNQAKLHRIRNYGYFDLGEILTTGLAGLVISVCMLILIGLVCILFI